MAGVRKKKLSSGKFQGYYTDFKGKQKFFTGTHGKAETLKIAQKIEDEHRQVKMGYRPAPNSTEKNRKRSFEDVASEYLEWGRSQGGRGGRPWSETHSKKTEYYLKWWKESLELELMRDLDGTLPSVEKKLRGLQNKGMTGRTLKHYAGGLVSFINWCVKRSILVDNPLRNLESFNITPRTKRRALTVEEIGKLLSVAPVERRLVYQTALTTGLRRGELMALTVDHLDLLRGGVKLDAEWTKNRKDGFQPLPKKLIRELVEFTKSRQAMKLYGNFYQNSNKKLPANPLLFVPKETARMLDTDLKAAEIRKYSFKGKLDFHALRVTYVTLIVEAGASAKEAQELARHSNPALTMNVYAKANDTRMAEIVEKIAKTAIFEAENAHSMLSAAVGDGVNRRNSNDSKGLRQIGERAEGGTRTPTPIRELAPEASASANSATSAFKQALNITIFAPPVNCKTRQVLI